MELDRLDRKSRTPLHRQLYERLRGAILAGRPGLGVGRNTVLEAFTQVSVNNWGIGSGVELPFGGLRFSGFGREKGLAALSEYSACKTTVVRVTGGVGGR